MEKTFDLRSVLAVTAGTASTTTDTHAVCDIVSHVTGNPGLGWMAASMLVTQARQEILQQHPTLKGAGFNGKPEDLDGWLSAQRKRIGTSTLTIAPMHKPVEVTTEQLTAFMVRNRQQVLVA